MGVRLLVRVKPRAGVSELAQLPDGTWTAKLKSAPVEGKANEELIALVADRFGCRKGDVTIKSGSASRTKLVQVDSAHHVPLPR
jgi:uncharacterized protein (TIGR00251 family)